MKKPFCFFALALLMAAVARAQSASAPIELNGEGPYYRVALPLAIHGLAAHGDLRDVRVVNAAGNAVPRAWLREETVEARMHALDAPVFPLAQPREGAAEDEDAAAVLTVRPDGTLAFRARRPAPARADADALQWIIDASRAQGSLLQARFTLPPETRGVFAFRLEASDDLRRWRRIGGQEQLVRLEQNGQTIERLAVDLERVRAHFLRLTWADARHAVALAGVGIDSIEEFEPAAPLQWLAPIPPERCATDYCDYLLPRGLPVQSLRIDLPEINTLAQVGIYGLREPSQAAPPRPVPLNPLYSLRHRRPSAPVAASGEIPLIDTVVYRLEQGGQQVRSPALALDGQSYARLRLRTRGPVSALGATPPSIAVAGAPRMLVFLAQGQGPFSLRWDEAADTPAPMALATLIPGYTAATPLRAGQASVALPSAATAKVRANAQNDAAPAFARKEWLWAALGVGLLLLAGMAWSLFASLRKGQGDA
jgi:hypothetical protein